VWLHLLNYLWHGVLLVEGEFNEAVDRTDSLSLDFPFSELTNSFCCDLLPDMFVYGIQGHLSSWLGKLRKKVVIFICHIYYNDGLPLPQTKSWTDE
jgi:hypothetical protein